MFNVHHLYQLETHGTHLRRLGAGEYFAIHAYMPRDSASNTNQCNLNLNCHMTVEMLFPLDLVHEMY